MAAEVDASDALPKNTAAGQPARDLRSDWIKGRVCTSLRVRDEQVQRLFAGDAK